MKRTIFCLGLMLIATVSHAEEVSPIVSKHSTIVAAPIHFYASGNLGLPTQPLFTDKFPQSSYGLGGGAQFASGLPASRKLILGPMFEWQHFGFSNIYEGGERDLYTAGLNAWHALEIDMPASRSIHPGEMKTAYVAVLGVGATRSSVDAISEDGVRVADAAPAEWNASVWLGLGIERKFSDRLRLTITTRWTNVFGRSFNYASVAVGAKI